MTSRGSPLPFYHLHQPGAGGSGTGSSFLSSKNSRTFSVSRFWRFLTCRRTLAGFRFREKYVVIFAFVLFVFVCYSGFIFLPDGPSGGLGTNSKTSLKKAIKNVFKNIPQPDADDLVIPKPVYYKSNKTFVPQDHDLYHAGEDPHRREDKERLRGRIVEADKAGQIPKPRLDEEQKELDRRKEMIRKEGTRAPFIEEIEIEQRREKVKEMMIHAWDNYKDHAVFGANELRPLSKTAHYSSVFGAPRIGATLIDGLDTLYIMGLLDRFEEGRKWVDASFNFSKVDGEISVFETTIRFVGGFLSCYALTGDELFKRKAEEVASALLPAFNTPTGIPWALVHVKRGAGKNYGWASGGASILSEFGTLHLEFEYLSIITKNPIYANKVREIRKFVNNTKRPTGLYNNYLNPRTGLWATTMHVSMGALGDSFYEYLLKSWLITNKRDTEGLRMYEDAMEGFKQLFYRSKIDNLFYIAELRGSRHDHKMDHLACFAGGMFGLHATNIENETAGSYWMDKAEELAHTCHESYIRTATGLGPESFRFTSDFAAKTINDRDMYYILRPEVIETWFYLWRITKKRKYREWGWAAVEAIEKYCRTEDGYSGIKNVYSDKPEKDDVQQSFFLAETLKYLYLLFSPDDVLPLDKWVFNTEAHPLPVRFEPDDVIDRTIASSSSLSSGSDRKKSFNDNAAAVDNGNDNANNG